MKRPMKHQAGFTLVELMMSAVAAGIVMLAAGGFMLRALGWYDELSAKIEMNRHAREVYRVMAYGGKAATTGNDGTKYVYGVRGRSAAPAAGMRTNYAFSYTSNQLTLAPDTMAAMTVTCTSATAPLADCGTGPKTVAGWMAADVTVAKSYTIADDTVEVLIPIMSPYQVQRAKAVGEFTDVYRAIFTLNRMESDP